MKEDEHVACMGEVIEPYKILTREHERRSRCRWKNYIRLDLRK